MQATLPGADGTEATFKNDLAPYIRHSFPKCPVAPATNAVVTMSTMDPLEGNDVEGTAWRYNYVTGEFICNNENSTTSDPSVNYDDL